MKAGFPLGPRCNSKGGVFMIDMISKLWSLLTVFFSSAVFTNDLFLALIVVMSIFGTIYIFMTFLDSQTWRW